MVEVFRFGTPSLMSGGIRNWEVVNVWWVDREGGDYDLTGSKCAGEYRSLCGITRLVGIEEDGVALEVYQI